MNQKEIACKIALSAIEACLPDRTVEEGLRDLPPFTGELVVVAIGKAAFTMAKTAKDILGNRIARGIVITKYQHIKGEIPGFVLCEAGHPVPDENSLSATQKALAMTKDLTEEDLVLFLVSGGGSALFESVSCGLDRLKALTEQLLACGASIEEINAVRKHLSEVKGGRFAVHCAPAKVHAILLSDVLGDSPDAIASGPSVPDPTTCADCRAILDKYGIVPPPEVLALLERETPKTVTNSTYRIGGSVRELCLAAAREAEACGYRPILLTDRLTCEAKEAGRFLGAMGISHSGKGERLAFVAGGETVVHLRGKGRGGRNQELALAAALEIEGLSDVCVLSAGSDGTDGPTDAAGGVVDGDSVTAMRQNGVDPEEALVQNDSYRALAACDGLVMTGPTGTNVNDVAILLVEG